MYFKKDWSLSLCHRSTSKSTDYLSLLLDDKTDSLLEIALAISEKIKDAEVDEPSELNQTFAVSMCVLSLYSSAVFFPSAVQAGERYAEMIPKHARSVIAYGGGTASVVTNTFFNWSSFCEIWQGDVSFLLWCSDALKAFLSNPIQHMFALLNSAGTILPFWYISLTDDMGWNFFVTTAALANIPVFYYGSEVFFEVITYAEMVRFALQLQWLLASITCRDRAEINKRIELTRIKSLLITHFLKLADDFRMASDHQKTLFTDYISSSESNEALFAKLLEVSDSIALPDYHNPIREDYVLLFLKYFVLGGLGMLQNFGHAVEAYRFGAQYHWSAGAFCLLFNLLPGLGYTIKGIMGYGLLELLFSKTPPSDTARTSYFSMMTFFLVIARVCYLLSGLSGDELNYQSVLFFNREETLLALIIGIFSNIGTALVFNAPQCEVKLQELSQPKPLRSNDRYQKQLDAIVHDVRTLPLEVIEVMVNHPKTEGAMQRFFKNKNFDCTLNTDSKCNKPLHH